MWHPLQGCGATMSAPPTPSHFHLPKPRPASPPPSFPATAAADMQPDEEAEEGAELRQHRRGMSPYVFVPFEQVATHVINLPVSEMDVFLPG